MTAAIIILHYTYGWSQQFVESYKKHMSLPLLIFNNNPFPDQTVKKTRGRWTNDANHLCQKELEYLKNEQIIEVPRPKDKEIKRLPYHGEVLDFAFDYCKHYAKLLHLEPDCTILGDQWWQTMKKQDNWVIGTGFFHTHGSYVMKLCPTLWDVAAINNLDCSFNKYNANTNTGQKIMRVCADQGKVCSVGEVADFEHHGNGSKKRYIIKL